MNKRLTRLLSLIMVLAMFLSVGTPAFAQGGTIGGVDEGWDREIDENEIRDFDAEPDNAEPDKVMELVAEDEDLGYTVVVDAPMGALPTLTELRVEPVEIEDIREAVEGVVEGEPNILIALDISFWLGNDEIEPGEPVQVFISAPELEGRRNLTLVHVPDEDEPETLDLITEDELGFALGTNEIAFKSKDFSVYAVIEGDDSAIKLTVEFYAEYFEPSAATHPNPVSLQVLVKEQFANEPLIDPGVPELTDEQSFEGWRLYKVTKNGDQETQEFLAEHKGVKQINDYIQANKDSFHDGDVLRAFAMIFEVRYVVYTDQAGAVLRTQAYHVDANDPDATVTINHPYVGFKGSQNFVGWILETKVDVAGDYPLYVGEINAADAAEGGDVYYNETAYKQSDIVLNENNELRLAPYLNTGFWLVFNTYKDQDLDNTSTTFIAPVFYEEGVNTVAPTAPTRIGYEFKGWYKSYTEKQATDSEGHLLYTDADGNMTTEASTNGTANKPVKIVDQWGERFIFGSPLSEKTTIYARWEPKNTNYHVVFWVQKATDEWDAEEEDKTYDFYDSAIYTAATGSLAELNIDTTGTTADNRLGYNENGEDGKLGFYFLYNGDESDTDPVVVKGDGSTVLNVYYDRKVITFEYYESDKTTLWQPTGSYVAAENGEYYYYEAQNTGYYLIGTGPNADYQPANGDTVYYYDTYSDSGTYALPTYDNFTKYRASLSSFGGSHTYNEDSNTYYVFTDHSETRIWYESSSSYPYRPLFYQFTENYTTGYYRVGTGPKPNAEGTHNLQGAAGKNIIKGLYGHQLSSADWPNSGSGYVWANDEVVNGSSKTYYYPLALTEYVPVLSEGAAETDYMKFYLQSDTGTEMHIYYVGQEIGGTAYNVSLTDGVNTVGSGTNHWYPNETIEGFTVACYWFESHGSVTSCTTATEITLPTSAQVSSWGDLYVGFTRNTYKFEFYSNNGSITPDNLPTGTDLDAVPYKQSLSAFASADPGDGPLGCFFEGWFADPALSIPFDFDATMPASNVRVYAKWTLMRFRVVCDPTGGENIQDPASVITLPNNQATTFRVDYGESVEGSNLNNAERPGYTLLGWYLDTDPDNDTVFDTPFDFGTPMTDQNNIADMTYGVQQPGESDADYIARRSGVDPWKNNKAYNDEDGAHDDVVGKVTVYARWRQDPDGIIGINVRYNAVEGEGTLDGNAEHIIKDDPNIYADRAQAYTQPAAVPNAPAEGEHEMRFLYWEILDRDDNPVGIAYPGMTFEVLFDYAVEEPIVTSGSDATDPEPDPEYVTYGDAIPRLVMPGDNPVIQGEPTRATATYQKVTTLTPGKRYLISYTNGSTAYLMSNELYSGNYRPKIVSTTVTNDTVTGDFDAYLFGVEYNSTYGYHFGSLSKLEYLSSTGSSNYYPYFGSDSNYPNRSYWKLTSENKLQNYSTNRYLGYSSNNTSAPVFFTTFSSASDGDVITFYERVENATVSGEEFDLTTELVVGGSYIIAIGDNAVGNQPMNDGGNDHFILAIHGYAKTSSFVVPTAEVDNATWEVVSGDATNGFILKNKGNGTYLGMSTDGNCYLAPTTESLAAHWTYDNGTDLNNHVTESANYSSNNSKYYYYLSFATDFMDFTTSTGSGHGVKLYSVTKTYTVTFKDGYDNSVIEVQQVEEGANAVAPEIPDHTAQGYVFNGWSREFDNVTENIEVTAQYKSVTELSYTVTFRYMNSAGEWIDDSQTVKHGDPADDPHEQTGFPAPPAGYTFNSWDRKFNKVTGNMTINAVYKHEATKKYVVNLRAVYGRADAGSVTHIYWYSNAYDAYGNPIPGIEDKIVPVEVNDLFGENEKTGTENEKNRKLYRDIASYELEEAQQPDPNVVTDPANPEGTRAAGDKAFVEGKGYNLIYDGIDITERVKIPTPYTLPGYTFLGWARVPTGTDNSEIGPDNVYLKWVEDESTEGGHYETRQTNTVENQYHLFGAINGNDHYACDDNYLWLGEYHFDEYGMLTTTFTQDSWVAVKTGEGNDQQWFMTNGYPGDAATSATLLDTSITGENSSRLYVPGNVEVTFTLIERDDGSKWLGYYIGKPSAEGWTIVTHVAADEEKPYHDMFAVWQGSFQIYHSGLTLNEGSKAEVIETVVIDRKLTDGFNLAERTSTGFLYGGYYIAKEGGFQPPALENGVREGYDGTNWTWKNAETECGLSMTPAGGEMYYIKEVPADLYLRPYFQYTYYLDDGRIATGWLISDIDDLNYTETGFLIVSNNEATIVKSLTVNTTNGGNSIKLTPKRLFSASGYLTYAEVINNCASTGEFGPNSVVLQYWVTPDGLMVTSTVERTYVKCGNNSDFSKDNITTSVTEKAVASKITELSDTSGDTNG